MTRLRLAILAAVLVSAGVSDAAERGAVLFEPCRACHALTPGTTGMAGPNLAGLIGRRVGGDPDYDYSPVLREAGASGAVWTPARLDAFLRDPDAMFPGLWMSYRGLGEDSDRHALAVFLADPDSR